MPPVSVYSIASRYVRLLVSAGIVLAAGAFAQTDNFASAMNGAVDRMDRTMMIDPSGNPDRDFAAMMIAHHQGAIDMARAELQFGKDERLRRLAQGIIVEQNQEIAAMRAALAEPPQASRNRQ